MNSHGVFAYLGGSIDTFLAAFVSSVSSAMAAAITPMVAVGLTLYVTVYGLAVMRHEVGEPVGTFVAKAIKMSIILGFALSSGFYQSEIVDGAQALQNGLVTIVAPNANGNIYGALDDFNVRGGELGTIILGRGMTLFPIGGWLDIIAALLVFTAMTAMLIICGGFLIMAKTAMAFVLGVGPMFIASLAFPPVAKFFDAWFAKIMNYTFLTVILAFVVSATIAICDGYVKNFLKTQDATNEIADAFGLVILVGSLLILLWQAPALASGLAGGASLSGGGLGNFIAGVMTGRSSKGGGGGKDDKKGDSGGKGGSIEGGGGDKGGGGKGRTPAYRRAALDRVGKR